MTKPKKRTPKNPKEDHTPKTFPEQRTKNPITLRRPQTQTSKRVPQTSGAYCAQRGAKLAQGTRLGATH